MRVPLLEQLKLDDGLKRQWPAKPWQKKMKKNHEEMSYAMLKERQKVERRMIHGMKAWNLIAASVSDPRISNILLPLIRMICRVVISSLTKELPGYNFRPKSKDDEKLVDIWIAANNHIDVEAGMMAEMEDFVTNLIVTGNGALEDRVETPYRFDRKWNASAGDFDITPVRDRSRPRITTISRHPMEYAFATWCKDPNGRVPTLTRDFYSWNEFAEISETKLPDGSYKYEDVEYVLPGFSCDFGTNDLPQYIQENHDGVAIITIQDPISNINAKYANGILITKPETIALSDLCTLQRPTLSVGKLLHTYESNYRAPMSWGTGFPHILRGLDAFYQAIGNLTIENWKQANTNVVAVKNGSQTALDPDLAYLSGMRIEGDVLVSPLGRVNLADFSALKTMVDEFCIFLTGYDFRKLVGDLGGNTTAFAFQKRLEAESVETEHLVNHLENTCLWNHGRVRLDFIINQMTVEEYEDITDEETMQKIMTALGDNKAAKEDYKFDASGTKPVSKVVRETIRVPGYEISEEYDEKGKRSRMGLNMKKNKEMVSDIPVVSTYFKPSDGRMPEVEAIGSRMHGLQNTLRFQKTQFLSNYGRQRIAEAQMNPNVPELQTDFDARLLDEELVRATEVPMETVMASKDPKDGKISGDDVRAIRDKLRKQLTSSPTSNAEGSLQNAGQALQGVKNVPSGGLGSLEETGGNTALMLAGAAAGAS